MLHRIFIAINLPQKSKEQLLKWQHQWPELKARWTTEENLHLTLAFLGNTSDQELAEVCNLLKQVGERHSPFSVEFTSIAYGPSSANPRMIWAVGKKSSELLALQKDIENTLVNSNQIHFQRESRPFSLHLTLARLKAFELQRLDAEEFPEVHEDVSISLEAKSFEVMESTLKRSGAEYAILQSIPLG